MKKYLVVFVGLITIAVTIIVLSLVISVTGGLNLEYTNAADVKRAIIAPIFAIAVGGVIFIKRHIIH